MKKRDKICILEPSCTDKTEENILEERLPVILKDLQDRGFEAVIYKDSFTSTPLGLGDGTEQLRAVLFNRAVKGPEIKAVFSFKGGYGAMQILDKIDYEAFR